MNSEAPLSIRLARPTERCRESFLRALGEFQEEALPWHVAVDRAILERDFGAVVAAKLAEESRRTETLVPASHYWALASGDEFVGRITIRHELNDALRIEGGHIGYDTAPSSRGRGVATEMLRQALPLARGLGLSMVLLTCDDTNAASIRVIEKNGGRLERTATIAPERRKRYYWIDL